MEHQEKLIKAVNAELEEWRLSGDTDYLYKAMAVIHAEIDNELQHEGGSKSCAPCRGRRNGCEI